MNQSPSPLSLVPRRHRQDERTPPSCTVGVKEATKEDEEEQPHRLGLLIRRWRPSSPRVGPASSPICRRSSFSLFFPLLQRHAGGRCTGGVLEAAQHHSSKQEAGGHHEDEGWTQHTVSASCRGPVAPPCQLASPYSSNRCTHPSSFTPLLADLLILLLCRFGLCMPTRCSIKFQQGWVGLIYVSHVI